MRSDTTTVGHRIEHYDPDADRIADPASIASDPTGQPAISVYLPQQPLDIDKLRLQFDDKKRTSSRVVGEDINNAAFTKHRKRDLRGNQPLMQPRESTRKALVEGRVAGGQQAV